METLKDRIYLELLFQKSIETDENGNYIVWVEASNENLDVQEQQVLQRTLLDSADYFLQNGVVSYDHRHIRPGEGEKDWHPEKYIIGEPIDVIRKGSRTIVKAMLYKSNKIAQDIIEKLKDGATRVKASVGGRLPKIVKEYSEELGKAVEKVVGVKWDELAITYKPVNQTLVPASLSPKAFVKSLQTGSETDAAKITGGQALMPQDLEGSGKTKDITGVIMALTFGDVKTHEEGIQFLKNRGYSEDEAQNFLKELVKNKSRIRKGVEKMDNKDNDKELEKAFDEAIETLEKALDKKEEKVEKPEKLEKAEKEPPKEPAPIIPPAESEEEEGKKEETKKSILDDVKEEAEEYLNVSPFLEKLTKSISEAFGQITGKIEKLDQVQKSTAEAVLQTARMTKAISDSPNPRQAVLAKSERTFMGKDNEKVIMSRDEILAKARKAMEKDELTFREVSIIEDRLNKGIPIKEETLVMLKAL